MRNLFLNLFHNFLFKSWLKVFPHTTVTKLFTDQSEVNALLEVFSSLKLTCRESLSFSCLAADLPPILLSNYYTCFPLLLADLKARFAFRSPVAISIFFMVEKMMKFPWTVVLNLISYILFLQLLTAVSSSNVSINQKWDASSGIFFFHFFKTILAETSLVLSHVWPLTCLLSCWLQVTSRSGFQSQSGLLP